MSPQFILPSASAQGAVKRDDLAERITRSISARTGGRVADLHVRLQGREVLLTGCSPTFYVKQLATHAALAELRNETLTNAIAVQEQVGEL